MLDKNRITAIVEEFLQGSPLFLVELRISRSNHIGVFIDGDQGVPISSCVELSRHLESQLDREIEDFELEVSSTGIDKPLVLPRQFRKNVGREVAFILEGDKKVKGKLLSASETSFTIEKQLPKKKKNDTTPSEEPVQQIPYTQATDVKVQISFKG